MASPARLQTPARNTPDVQTRPGSVPRAGVSNTAARKSSLQSSQRQSRMAQSPRPKQTGMRAPTPGSTMPQSSPNEALRKSNFNASRLATAQPMVNPQPAQNQPAANDNQETAGEEQNESTEEETDTEESNGQEMGEEEENAETEEEEAADAEEEASDAENRSILQSDQLAARVQAASVQAASSTESVVKEQGKKIVMEGAAYSFGALFGTLDTLSGGLTIIMTAIGDIPILGRWNVQMLFGGKLPFVDPLSWEPIPLLPVVDPNAMGKKLLIIIADFIFVFLILFGMTLIGLIAYMMANPAEAAARFGPAIVQLFATTSPQ